ncbi:MAG TPA: hypothetical protein VFY02_07845 [Gaiellaceae bacterium]|nr:hypothetical protein [Gaiellaceae bacterium]
MRLEHLALVLIVVAGCGAAAGDEAAPQPSATPLPLADGNRWVLRDDERGSTATISVARTPSGLVLRGVPGTGDVRVRTAGRAVQAWDTAGARWVPFLRLGAPAGTRYTVALSGAPLWRSLTVTVASRTAVVRDGRGRTLRNCVRLTFATRKPVADAAIEELVFAPGVGFVRTAEQTIAGTRVRVLAAVRLRP